MAIFICMQNFDFISHSFPDMWLSTKFKMAAAATKR